VCPGTALLALRLVGVDEQGYRSVRFFQNPGTKAWTRYEPWMTTIVDLDTGQVLGIVGGRDHTGVGEWLFATVGLGAQVVAIDPSAAFRKALRMWLPGTAVSVDLFHMTMLTNDMLTTVRQGLSQQVKGRGSRATDPAWANRMLLLKANENLSERGHHRLAGVFAADDLPGSLEAAWQVKEQLCTLLNTGSLEEAGRDQGCPLLTHVKKMLHLSSAKAKRSLPAERSRRCLGCGG
jgi:transposase